ncbi:MAG TPA: hypothetical protein VH877_33280 [Polyangia bacterium]|jgi:hypothetical protein|nr:hypothetical protein [Polyangia bacterium]
MTLKDKFDAIKAQLGKMGFSSAKLELMHRATEELRQTITKKPSLRVGDRMPDFQLRSVAGAVVRSQDLLARGPLVINFYRGVW